ncbi:MAG: polysaccharide deacetylase family protein [Promethearchaeota archaeon]|jgi:peptidoglycan/xylan/chitin deacetylase (PgdA/CDA1 family)
MKISLTFDIERDFPHVLDTYYGIKFGVPKIVDVLESFRIKGTFFCTGNVAEHFPDKLKLIESKGHEIACHSLNHEPLRLLNYENCYELIFQNKTILENICKNSEILGFRAPYLQPSKDLIKVLNNLGFKYDSSFRSEKMVDIHHLTKYKIQEFHPLSFNSFLRLPFTYSFYRKWLFKKGLIILCFHPWEATSMRDIILNRIRGFDRIKHIILRPDRIINTGKSFITRISKFIKESLYMKAEFIMLNQLLRS